MGRRPIWVCARKSMAAAAAMVARGWLSSSKGSRVSVLKCDLRLSAASSGSRVDSSRDRMTVLDSADFRAVSFSVMSSRRMRESVSTRISAGSSRSRWSMMFAAGSSIAANSPVDASSHERPACIPRSSLSDAFGLAPPSLRCTA